MTDRQNKFAEIDALLDGSSKFRRASVAYMILMFVNAVAMFWMFAIGKVLLGHLHFSIYLTSWWCAKCRLNKADEIMEEVKEKLRNV